MTPFIKNALALLNAERISDAIVYIRKRLIADRNIHGLDLLESINSTYNYLLKYLIEGQPDPDRERIYTDIREKLYSIVRSIEVSQIMAESPLLYYSQLRTNLYSGKTFGDALGRFITADTNLLFANNNEDSKSIYEERRLASKDIFNIVWTLPIGKTEELKAIIAAACGKDFSCDLTLMIVAAITQSLLFVYDREKLIALTDIYSRSEDDRVRARALMGILLTINRYSDRLKNDYELRLRFESLMDAEDFSSNLRSAFLTFVKVRGSLNLMHKINTEILPDIISMSPSMMNQIKKMGDDVSIDKLEANPEWEKMMNSGMEKKLRKLSNIQNEGGDILLSMFASLAPRFHYFSDIDTWFTPFSPATAQAAGIAEDVVRSASIMEGNTAMCDLDKFAMLLNLNQLPESTRRMVDDAMKAQQEQMSEEFKELELRIAHPTFERELENYTRGLMRFYNYFRLHSEFNNPFENAIDPETLPFIGSILSDSELLSDVAEFYFKQGFYEDSIRLFKRLADSSPLERGIYCQKIGFAYEKLGNLEVAFEYYTDDSLDGMEDQWLNKKIAKVGSSLGRFDKVNESLTILHSLNPDNLTYLIELAKLKLVNPKFDNFDTEAGMLQSGKLLSRAYYIAPDNLEVRRLMAAKSRIGGEYDKAMEYISGRLSEISMYLAEISLSPDNERSASKEEELEMASDLFEGSTIAFANEDLAAGIEYLSNIFMLKESGLKRSDIRKTLQSTWATDPALKPKQSLIPLFLEAATK